MRETLSRDDIDRLADFVAEAWAAVKSALKAYKQATDAQGGWVKPLSVTNKRSVFPTAMVWTSHNIYLVGYLEDTPLVLDRGRWASPQAWLPVLNQAYAKAGVVYLADLVEMSLDLASLARETLAREAEAAQETERVREARDFLLGLVTIRGLSHE